MTNQLKNAISRELETIENVDQEVLGFLNDMDGVEALSVLESLQELDENELYY